MAYNRKADLQIRSRIPVPQGTPENQWNVSVFNGANNSETKDRGDLFDFTRTKVFGLLQKGFEVEVNIDNQGWQSFEVYDEQHRLIVPEGSRVDGEVEDAVSTAGEIVGEFNPSPNVDAVDNADPVIAGVVHTKALDDGLNNVGDEPTPKRSKRDN